MRHVIEVVAVLLVLCLPRAASAQVRVFDAEIKGHPLWLDLFGFVSPRFTWQDNDTRPEVQFTPNPAFTLFRSRFGVIAQLSERGKLHFEIELGRDFSQGIDAFAEGHLVVDRRATVSVRLGQYRVPFSGQNLLQAKSLQLPEPAYFVTPKYVVDRDIGAMVIAHLWDDRIRVYGGVFNGNEPGRGQAINIDPSFLYAGRLEISPFGTPPRHESDTRTPAERRKPAIALGGGAMYNVLEAKHYQRLYIGADAGIWWHGASIYGELYRRTDTPDCSDDPAKNQPCGAGVAEPAPITAEGLNVQVGYFPHLPWVHEHLEIAFRFQQFDPYVEVETPSGDSGERDLEQANPTWGYRGFAFGLNLYPLTWGHDFKLQASYELRNELKRCLVGQSGDGCTGFIKNDVFQLQGTVAF